MGAGRSILPESVCCRSVMLPVCRPELKLVRQAMSFFALKKLFVLLLMPSLWMLVLALLAFWAALKQHRRRALGLGATAVLLLLLTATAPLPNLLMSWLERPYRNPVLPSPQIEQVVVLGGGVFDEPTWPLSGQLSQASLYRLTEGIRLWRKLAARQLVLSGGALFGAQPEALLMQQLAIELGVPQSAIRLDIASKDTAQQARWLAAQLADQPFLLVTSASHLRRSMAWLQAQGLQPKPWPAEFKSPQQRALQPSDFALSGKHLLQMEQVLYEGFGLLWLWLASE